MSTKYEILAVLERNRDKPISGQQLADMLGVSRTAVWKAVKALEEDGHVIKAQANKGYTLHKESNLLTAEGIMMHLPFALRDNDIHVYDTVDSTNTQARRAVLDGAPHGTVVVAEEQTAGRGRRGKSFYSPRGTGLYMSLILHPRVNDIQDVQMITVAAAVAVCEAIEKLTPLKPQIKWVNDIFVDGKKVCGILSEAIGDFESGQIENVVLGIGVNNSTVRFPGELGAAAGSLNMEGLSRNHLAAEIILRVYNIAGNLKDRAVIEGYKSRSLVPGRKITYMRGGAVIPATALDINDNGNLVVRDDTGEVNVLNSGEVSLREWNI